MAYWIASLLLIAFGFLAAFSIGQPFLLIGVAMLLLRPFRGRPLVFWPLLLAVIGWTIGYWAVAPFSCSASQPLGGAASTVCTSLIGLRYEGLGIYNPPFMPAIAAGTAVALLTAIVVLGAVNKRRLPNVQAPLR